MSAHTPGPWSADHDNVRTPADGGMVAKVAGDTDAQAYANARLIAAAPDLLAALRDLVSAEGLPEGYANRAMLIDAARAALAKAEGR